VTDQASLSWLTSDIRLRCPRCGHLLDLPESFEYRLTDQGTVESRRTCNRCDRRISFRLTVEDNPC
jgi:RNase P subunit RPR2